MWPTTRQDRPTLTVSTWVCSYISSSWNEFERENSNQRESSSNMEKWDEKNNSIPLACHQQSDTETTKARKEEHRGRRGRNGRSLKKKRAKEGESQLDIQSGSPQTSFHQSLHQREESLSYAIVLHIAFKIYVPARIMQLDDCVEKTPINLILFGFGFFFLLLLLAPILSPSTPLQSPQSAFSGNHLPPSASRLLFLKVFRSQLLSYVNTVFCWACKDCQYKTQLGNSLCGFLWKSVDTEALSFSF